MQLNQKALVKLGRAFAPSQQYRLRVYYPDQKRFIIVGYGTRRAIEKLHKLYLPGATRKPYIEAV